MIQINRMKQFEYVLKVYLRQAYVDGINDLSKELSSYSTGISALSEERVKEWIDEQKNKVFE